MARRLEIRDLGAARRIGAAELRIAFRPAAIALESLLDRACRQETEPVRCRVGQRAQRHQIINDPNAASVGRDHQVMVPMLNSQIPHRDGREIAALKLRPVRALIHRDPKPKLGTEVQHASVRRILTDHVRIASHPGAVSRQPRPGCAVILRDIHVRDEVTVGVPVKGGVGHTLGMSSLDGRHPAGSRQAGDVGHDVMPRFTVVPRQLQIAVIRAGPNHTGFGGTFGDRVNRRVHLSGRVVDRDATRLFLLLFIRIVRRQIRRDACPALTMVAGEKQELRTEVQPLGIMRRQGDRRVPIKAQLLV